MDKVVVLGAGTMGRGIAQVSALAGYPTVLTDISSEVLQSGVDGIQDFWRKVLLEEKPRKLSVTSAWQTFVGPRI